MKSDVGAKRKCHRRAATSVMGRLKVAAKVAAKLANMRQGENAGAIIHH